MGTIKLANFADIVDLRSKKQDKLISGGNIKTINGQSILGQGNITIQQDVVTKLLLSQMIATVQQAKQFFNLQQDQEDQIETE